MGEMVDPKVDIPSTHAKERDFSRFDKKQVAVILKQDSREFVYRGIAIFQIDDELGRILRIRSEVPNEGELILSEATWAGRIVPDLEHGCSLCFIPDPHAG